MTRRRPPERRVLRLALEELEGLLRGPDVDRPMSSWDDVIRAVPENSRDEGRKLVIEELRLASHVHANGSNPWNPAPTLGTLLRLTHLNVQAALRRTARYCV